MGKPIEAATTRIRPAYAERDANGAISTALIRRFSIRGNLTAPNRLIAPQTLVIVDSCHGMSRSALRWIRGRRQAGMLDSRSVAKSLVVHTILPVSFLTG
jgi:hypothetical protein